MLQAKRACIAHILLVEDDVDDVRLIKRAFKKSNLEADLDVVYNGRDALEHLQGQDSASKPSLPDLVLLDLNLPGLDGIGVLKAIREDERLRKLPVVILSTSKNKVDIAKCYELHANCFVSKPSDLETFNRVITNIQNFWFNVVELPRLEGC